jgi:hypothetical protein
MASVASQNGKSVVTADNIMIAGLAFQVITLFAFMALALDFALRVHRRRKALGASALDQNPRIAAIRGSWLFKGFVAAITLSTICIFWRCVFRVAELSDGWSGPLMHRQDLFVGFEGVMIVVACLALNFFHPAVCCGELMEGAGGLGGSRRKAKDFEMEGAFKSGNASDSEGVRAGARV